MKNFSDLYSITDDYFWTCYFDVNGLTKSLLSNVRYLKSLKKKLIDFHLDYIKLSQKYTLAEIAPIPFLQKKGISLKREYKAYLEDLYYEQNNVNFFPYWQNDSFNIQVSHASSNILTLFINDELTTNYMYNVGAIEIELLKDVEMNSTIILNSSLLKVFQNSIYLEADRNYEPFELSFSLEISSDLWFETVSRNRRLWDKTYGEPYLDYDDEEHEEPALDNRFIAYRNTPRFNSFLRDLKTLFVDKYGWSYDSDYDDIRRDGIPLDGKIIYQEDIDQGRVKLPDIESFGKVVEAGQYF